MRSKAMNGENLAEGHRLTVCIPEKMYEELAKSAKEEGVSVSIVIRKLIREHLSKRNRKHKRR